MRYLNQIYISYDRYKEIIKIQFACQIRREMNVNYTTYLYLYSISFNAIKYKSTIF